MSTTLTVTSLASSWCCALTCTYIPLLCVPPARFSLYTRLTLAVAIILILSSYWSNVSSSAYIMLTFLFCLLVSRPPSYYGRNTSMTEPLSFINILYILLSLHSEWVKHSTYAYCSLCYLLSTILCISQPIAKALTYSLLYNDAYALILVFKASCKDLL